MEDHHKDTEGSPQCVSCPEEVARLEKERLKYNSSSLAQATLCYKDQSIGTTRVAERAAQYQLSKCQSPSMNFVLAIANSGPYLFDVEPLNNHRRV